MTTAGEHASASSSFVTTRWTQVLSARGPSCEARAALGDLCAAYWVPIFRFVCRSGYNEDEARDHTQAFVAQFLARNGVDAVEPAKGRFRSYLLGAVKHFLSDQKDRAAAVKRGGGQIHLHIDEHTETSTTVEIPDPSGQVSDTFFDRQWALHIIDRALKQLAQESVSDGKAEYFDAFKPWLVAEASLSLQADVGQKLGLSEGATKVAIHRFRKRFRALVKSEIAQTVSSPDQTQEELRYLIEVLSQG
jgi:DNA-directed RNA polymerase specialized sigma24 family protein